MYQKEMRIPLFMHWKVPGVRSIYTPNMCIALAYLRCNFIYNSHFKNKEYTSTTKFKASLINK